MAFDIDKFMSLDLSYPGISFGYESWALETYLKVLDDHVSFAQDQYRIRAEREIKKRAGDFCPEEYGQKLSEIDEAVETEIPRFFRIGALIPIWGLFESFVFDIARWVGKREKIRLSIRDVRASNFRSQVEKYFEGVLRIELPWSLVEREKLGQLQELRNFIAHRNGRLMDLSLDKEREIKDLVAKVHGVTIENSTLVVSAEYISQASALVFEVVGKLNQLIGDRYGGPTAQKSEP